MDNDHWRELIEEHFEFLFKKQGFEITSNEYFEEMFGGRITRLENERLLIIIELDRDVLTVRIVSKEHPEFIGYLDSLIGYLNNKPAFYFRRNDLDPVEQLAYSGQLFEANEDIVFNYLLHENWIENKQNYMKYIKRFLS